MRAESDKDSTLRPFRWIYTERTETWWDMAATWSTLWGGCNDCHTNPSYAVGGDPFMGQPKQVNAAHYLAGGMTFGPFVSRNLTPENGLPAGHTYQDFVKIMRTGIDLDQAHPQFGPLLQVMPWPTYQSMTDHDLRAIYEYLRSIPSATPGP